MSRETTFSPADLADVTEQLREADLAFVRRYPGEPGHRKPVHVVYGGAHLFKADTAVKLGRIAAKSFDEHAPDPAALARVFEMPEDLAAEVHPRIAAKLRSEPVEAYHIDFEDGYGLRPDAEEDGHAVSVAREIASGLAAGTLPAFLGIRIKALSGETRDRAIRTLDLFLTALSREAGGRLPEDFAVALPKVSSPEQVDALAGLLDRFEPALGFLPGSLRLEIMVETPQALLSLLPLAEAGRGRCAAAHLGTYDLTAALGITATYQTPRHPVTDFARHTMQTVLAGTGIRLADGATTNLPVGDREMVHTSWKIHYENIWSALVLGFYQGWDLHPAQLIPRYAAVYAFFREVLDEAGHRLRSFIENAARATRVGQVFDDAATGQGLLSSFLQAVQCGAITEQEAVERSGLTLEELRGRSFARILEGRG